jgi:lipopolysaccharide/colanic/teichoic acid biosynthesis glycosyltransferase
LALRPAVRDVALVAESPDRGAPDLVIVLHASRWEKALKRSFDVLVGTLLLLATLPLWIIVGLCVWATSRGPVFFCHERVGRGGRRIRVTKFRTMVPGAASILDADPELRDRYVQGGFKLRPEDDPRITRFGSVLRRLSLDELPQIWDVLRGRMSIVGPRPVVADELESYGHYVGAYLSMRPGITGLWQVNGRSDVGFPERARIDYSYASRWSLGSDVKVLLRTIPSVLRRRGAY